MSRITRSYQPAFELLEERIMLAAQPVVAISGATEAQLGAQTAITITFDNQPDGNAGSQNGYAPYVDLVLPHNGADGAGVGSTPPDQNDGISFASASFLGQSVSTTVLEFDANGEAVHPFARDATGALRVVKASDYGAGPGDQLVVLQLPFGSFTPEQTPAEITVQLDVSNLADVGTPLSISAVGGFAYGRDALNNPTVDPPVLGAAATTAITPTLATLSKSFSGDDGETTTGPNFPQFYLLNLDFATGQTLSDMVFRDSLPDGIVVTGTSIVSGPAGTIALDPATNDLTVTYAGPIVGAAGTDVQVRVDFYVGQFLSPGDPATPVLDPATGAPRAMENNLSVTATWTPIDDRDPTTTVTIDPSGPENVFVARALALQKHGVVDGGGAPEPGDTVHWTLSGEVSDYFSIDDAKVTDALSDGQSFVAASPVLTVNEGGVPVYTGAFDAANITATVNADGTTSLEFRVADELALRGLDPTLTGGRDGVTAGATTFAIAFDSHVNRFYADGAPLLQGDSISNQGSVGGLVAGSGAALSDGDSDTLTLARGEDLEKSVYLVNGVDPTTAVPVVTAGDTITFRLQYELPTGSANSFTLTDFLPLPVLLASGSSGPLTFQDIRNDGSDPATLPAVGTAWWHPDETFDLNNPTGYAGTPSITVNAAANSITFDFGSFHMDTPQPLKVDILFRLQLEDQPFGDRLTLTNQVTSHEENTAGSVVSDNALAQIELSEPHLSLTKGVVGVQTGQTTFATDFNPDTVGPVTFTDPGTAGTPFSGTVTTAMLAANPIDSDLSGVDAGDLVRFAIVVENTGYGVHGAHDILIHDVLPAGFVIPAGGLNLTITRGDGQTIAYTAEGGGLFDPAGGIRLTDPSDLDPNNHEGALTRFTLVSPDPGVPPTAPTGSNLAIIVYDLQVSADAATPALVMTNTAEIAHYATQDGGTDFAQNLLPDQREDDASVITGGFSMTKSLFSTSLPESTDPYVLIGEEATFHITLTLREGLTQDVLLTDLLPTTPGILSLVNWQVINLGANLSFTGTAPPVNAPQGGPVSINLGNVTNLADNTVDAQDQLVIEVHARVADVPQNNNGDVLVNTASVSYTDATGAAQTISDTASVTIVEPGPQITKTASQTSGDAGDIVTYTLQVTNPVQGGVSVPVFDVNVRDTFDDPDLSLVAGTVSISGSAAGNATILLGNGALDQSIRIFMSELDPGTVLTVTYQGRISDTVESGKLVRNVAIAQGDSAPGDVPDQRIYSVTDDATVAMALPALAKTITDTGLGDTGSGQGNPTLPDLAYGETVTYRVRATFAEGTTTDVSLVDLLPISPARIEVLDAAIAAVGASITAPGAILGAAGTLSDRDGDGANDTVVFNIGTVSNAPDGTQNAGDQLDVVIHARLITSGSATAGLTVTNQSALNFTSGGAPQVLNASASAETVAPAFSLTKVPDQLRVDGGDIVQYTVRGANNATNFSAAAYDITLTDLIDDPQLTLVVGSVTVAGATATIVEGNTAGDDTITITLAKLDPGQTVVITYDVKVADLAITGSQLVNTVSGRADTHPGVTPGEQPLTGSAGAVVQVGEVASEKTVAATSLTSTGIAQFRPTVPDLAIGETVTYRILETLPEGSTRFELADQLPVGAAGVLEFLSYQILPLPSTTNLDFVPGTEVATVTDTNGDGVADRLRLDFGTVNNHPDNVVDQNDQIVVLVTARLIDRPENQAGMGLTNTAQAYVNNTPVGPAATADIDVVEPRLAVTKVADVLAGDAGDIVTYTVTVAPDRANGSGPAYDVLVQDLVPTGTSLVVGSVTASAGNILSGNAAGDTQVRVALLSPTQPQDPAITITYQVRLLDSVQQGQLIQNEADLTYASAPSFARQYADDDTAAVRVDLTPQVAKNVVVTSLPETSFGFFDPALFDVAVGETVTYQVVTTLGEGTQHLVLHDIVPTDGSLTLLDVRLTRVGAGITGASLQVGDAATIAGNVATFDMGTVVNAGDNVTDANDEIAFTVVARVANAGANTAGHQIANVGQAQVSDTAGGHTAQVQDSATVEVVLPNLQITKQPSVTTGDAGDVVTWRLVVANAAGATAPAYQLQLSDLIPAGMEMVAGSVSTDRGTIVSGNAAGDTSVVISLGGTPLLPTNDPQTSIDEARVVVTYQTRLTDAVQPGQVLTNDASYAGFTAPSSGNPDARPLAGQTDADVRVVMPVALDKQIVATSLPTTGSSFFDPANPDLAIGEQVTYHLTATLSEGTQTLVIADTLPTGLVFVSGQVVSVGGGLPSSLLGTTPTTSGQGVSFNFGTVVNAGNNVAGDGTVVVEIVGRVADVGTNTAGHVLTNAGVVTVTSPDNPGAPGGTQTGTDTTSADVVAPGFDLTKTVDHTTGDAGDLFTYTIRLAPQATSSGPAYDVVIQDVLDAVLVPVTATSTLGTVSVSGQTIRLDIPLLLPTAAPIVLTIQARLSDAVEPGQVVSNAANLDYTTAPTNGRDGTGTASAPDLTAVLPVELAKEIVATSFPETGNSFFDPANPDLAVGEQVTYHLTATLSEGTQTLVIADTLPTGLAFVSGRVVSVGAGLPGSLSGTLPTVNGQGVSFNFGTVVNTGNNLVGDGTVVVEIVGQVLDVGTNAPGHVLTNAGVVSVTSPTNPGAPGGTVTDTDSTSADVVGPVFDIAKTVDHTTGDAGDVFVYTVTLTPDAASSGPAYNVVIQDVLDPVLVPITVASSAGTVTVTGQTIRLELPVVLPTDAPVVLTYQVRFADTVEPGQVVGNTADLTYNSAPNGGGRPGAGTTDGPDLTGVFSLDLVKEIVATSFPETGSSFYDPANPDLAIGEQVTYHLTATLSEGTQTLVIADTLPAGLTFVSGRVASVGAGLPASMLTTTAINAGQGVSFNFGTVVNTGNNVAGDGVVVVEIIGQVADVGSNTPGHVLTNAGTATVTAPTNPGAPGGTLTDTDSTSADVVAPDLVLEKTPPAGFARPGDILTYTLTLQHDANSSAPAYDLVLADPLTDANMVLVAGSVVTSAGTVVIGNTAGDTTLRIEIARVDVGQVVTVTFQTQVAATAPAAGTLTNTAGVDYDTAPGPGGRPGTDTDGATVPLAPGFAKVLDDTSLPETNGNDVAIGEVLTYELTATLPLGSVNGLSVADLLPAGLTPLSATVLSIGSGLSGSLLAPGAAGTIAGQAVTFAFGNITNASSAAIDDADRIVVQITARVADVAGSVAGTVLQNNAHVDYTIQGEPGTDGSTVPVTVVEPAMTVAKTVDHTTGDAGDLFTYTVTLTPGGTGPAYDVVVLDTLDAVLLPISASSTLGTASISGQVIRLDIPVVLPTDAPIVLTYQVRFADTVEPGRVVGNTANLTFDSLPGPGGREQTGSSSAPDLTGVFALDLQKEIVATSLPETGSAFFDPANPDLAIGETVTYHLTATLSEGTQTLVIADTLPTGLTFVSGRVVSVGAGLPGSLSGTTPTVNGQGVTFDFGTVVNTGNNIAGDGTVVVEIIGRVADVASNQPGTVLTNAGSATVTSPTNPTAPGGTLTDGDSTSADVVAPALDIAKTVDHLTGDAGDLFTYTVTITQQAGSSGPAYDMVVVDTLDAVLVPVAGSATSTLGTASIAGQVIRLDIPVLLPTDAPVVLTYQVRFTDAVEPGQVVGNTANLDFNTAPGGGGRPGDSSASAPDLTGVFALALDKTIIATSLPETGSSYFDPALPDVAIGEVITYQVVTTLSEGTQHVVLHDLLPDGLQYVAGSLSIVTGAGISAGAGGTLTPAPALGGQNGTLDFGTLVNAGDNVADAGDRITITFQAITLDVPGNAAGHVLTNAADATASAPTNPGAPGGTLTASDTASAEVVTPALDIDKNVDHFTGDAGDIFTYTVTLSHLAGESTAPAYVVVLLDSLPAPLELVAGSATTSFGSVTEAGNTVRIEIPVLLPTDPVVTVTYQARLADAVEPGQIITNTATVDYQTSPGQVSRPGHDSDTSSILGSFDLLLAKTIVDTSLPGTGSSFFDPNNPDLAIGEVVTYRLVVTVGEGTATLVVADQLPAGLVPETARVAAVGSGLPPGLDGVAGEINGQAVRFDFGTVVNTGDNDPANNTITIEVTARVADVAANQAGTLLTNGATATVTAPTSPGNPGGTITVGDSTGADVVTPDLVIDKVADRAFVALGDTVTYTITLVHAADSTAPAYNVLLGDTLAGTALRLVAGSVTTSFGTIQTGNGGGDTAVQVAIAELPIGQTVVVTFRAVAATVPPPDGTAPNTGTYTATSAPDGPPGFVRPFDGSDTAVVRISSTGPAAATGLADEIEDFLNRQQAVAGVPAIPAVYSGTAAPGSVVTLVARDGNGELVSQQSRMADMGGNWLVQVPTGQLLPPPPAETTASMQAATRLFADRDLGLNANSAHVSRPDAPPPTPGSEMDVVARQTPSLLGGVSQAPDAMRVYFAPPSGPFGFGTAPSDQLAGGHATGVAAVAADQAAAARPFGLALNKFALDFLSSSTVPTGRLY